MLGAVLLGAVVPSESIFSINATDPEPETGPEPEEGPTKFEARSSNQRVGEVAGLLPFLAFRAFYGFFNIIIINMVDS